MAIDLSYSE